MLFRKTCFAFCLSLTPALGSAQETSCPTEVDHSTQLDQLYGQLSTAPSNEIAKMVGEKLWDVWFTAPNDVAQRMLMKGMQGRMSQKYAAAEAVLTALIEYCPNYAEGHNQRAFVRYLRGDYDGALPDLIRALELRPRHLGAMSGKALVHLQMGDAPAADAELRRAWALNPWLPERHRLMRQGTDL